MVFGTLSRAHFACRKHLRVEARNFDARAHFDRVLERRDSLARSRGAAGGGVGQGSAIGGGNSRVSNGRVLGGVETIRKRAVGYSLCLLSQTDF